MCKKSLPLPTLLGSVFLLFSCTLAPEYERPHASVADTYPVQTENTAQAALPGWKEFFRDRTMQEIIGLALENNQDLRIAVLNIEKTRAQYGIQRADLLPTINATAEASRQHLPADLSPTGQKGITTQYSVGLGFSAYELDLFGRIRSLSTQALETFRAAKEEAKAARISLAAETAAAYLQLVADREQYDLTEATLENRQKNYDIIRRKFEAGVASDLDLNQARSLLDEAEANLAASRTSIGQSKNLLTLLVGRPLPEDLPDVRRLADVEPMADVPAGLPSELLERRPDIMAAEHTLKGAYANIGAARANFFPSIRLTGSFGTMSSEYNNLFEGNKGWSFIPQITLPIFDTGRNTARLEVSEADRDIAVAGYEKAVQTAFREVADALVLKENIDDQLKAQESLVSALSKSYEHASARYETGVSAYINVLDAQRSLFAAQSSRIATRLLKEANTLTLYKALGGGWE